VAPSLGFQVQNNLPATMSVTDSVDFNVTLQDQSGNDVTHATVVAESSDTSVISISPTSRELEDVAHFLVKARRAGVAEVSLRVIQGTGQVTVHEYRDTVRVTERWVNVSVGNGRTCGVTANSHAYCWGDGRYGLGDGGLQSSARPTQVFANGFVTSISVGGTQTCFTDAHALAYCWGLNRLGEIGDGTQIQRIIAVPVAVGSTFLVISAGETSTCGTTSVGKTYCWGESGVGLLGAGDPFGTGSCFFDQDRQRFCVPNPSLPVQTGFVWGDFRTMCTSDSFVDNGCMPIFKNISVGSAVACGSTKLGAVLCWGRAIYVGGPQLGTCPYIACSGPTLVGGAADWTSAAKYTGPTFVTVSSGLGNSCALDIGGTPWCWGAESFGPTAVTTSTRFNSITVGWSHICALTAVGKAYCWGANQFGELGIGTSGPPVNTPTAVTGDYTFSTISVRNGSTCAVSVQGPLYCWGRNDFGQLGTGDTNNSALPTRVLEPNAEAAPASIRLTDRSTRVRSDFLRKAVESR